jgi:phosphoribosylanthranilate isomerase
MWVKICANTTLEDAVRAAELGADAVGFVFASSKRQVTPKQVAQITAALPQDIERIGVFDSHSVDEIAAAVSSAGLSGAQLHGSYDELLVCRLRQVLPKDIHIIQTLHWSVTAEAQLAADHLRTELHRIAELGIAQRVLVDSKVNGATGGTGVSFEWAKAQRVFGEAQPKLQLILAGGLKPENVGEAINDLHPWGVDVASGVEAEVGRKDPERMAQFIQRARAAKKA